jgi:hypothetical protein
MCMVQDEVVAFVRRRSSAFSRGKSQYRGVSGHNGRWEARIGSFGGKKNVSGLRGGEGTTLIVRRKREGVNVNC